MRKCVCFLIVIFGLFSIWKIENLYGQGQLSANFDIKSSVGKEDWKFFMKSSDSWKKDLWTRHKGDHFGLKDWSWSWRMAWLKACAKIPQETWCQDILQHAVSDQAMVVRSEAAKIFGVIYANTKNKEILNKLAKEFARPDNIRNGKPLYVQQLLLWAMWKINAEEANKDTEKMAKKYTQTHDYWRKLTTKL